MQAGVQAALASFDGRWKVSGLKSGMGRAASAIKDPSVAAAVQKVMTQPSLSAGMIPTSGQTDLANVLAPALFAVAAGSDHCYRETDCLATLRLCCSGTRQVVLVPIEAAWDAIGLSNKPLQGGTAPAEQLDLGKLCHNLLHLSASSVAIAFRKCSAFAGTLGPGDVLYTPAGWIVAERVLPGKGAQDVCNSEIPTLLCLATHAAAA